MPSPKWDKGNAAYKDFLDNLTEEQRAAHFAAKKLRSSLKKAHDAMLAYQMARWLSEYNTALVVQKDKAIHDADTHAFVAFRDSLGLKPESQITVDMESPLPWTDDFDEDEDE